MEEEEEDEDEDDFEPPTTVAFDAEVVDSARESEA